ncbi:MAG: hypothetical protein QW231_03415 [Candidatus Bathyarchaeia archaeon]
MEKTIAFLRWELSSLTRLRLLLPLVAFMFFTSYLGSETSWTIQAAGTDILFKAMAESVSRSSCMVLESIYLALAFFSVILVSASLAGDMDTGILKCYLSLPMSRLEVFVAKAMASYILLLSAGLGAIYYRAVMFSPEIFLKLLVAAPFYILQPGLFLALELLFTFSVSLYFSVVSRRAWHASLYSLLTLYLFYMVQFVVPGLRWYLPPYTFALGWAETVNISYFTLFSMLLTALSAYIFTRKLEVT